MNGIIQNKKSTRAIAYSAAIKKYINKSDYFLLPIIGLPIENFSERFGVFARCELDMANGQYCRRVYVVFNARHTSNENKFVNIKCFLKKIIINEDYVAYVYSINVIYLTDYDLFLKGRYSLMSNNIKELLIRTYQITKNRDIYNTIYPSIAILKHKSKILETNEILSEYSSKPILRKETFNSSKLYCLNTI